MKWYNFAPPREKGDIVKDNSLPVVKKQDIIDQALIILHQAGIRWVPDLGREDLVRCTKGPMPKFVFMPISLNYSSTVLNDNVSPFGSPLPHPVDGSFVFLVASIMATRIEAEVSQVKQEFLHSKTMAEDADVDEVEFSRYFRAHLGRKGPNIDLDTIKEESKLQFNARNFIGFILFHYHRPQKKKSGTTPKFGNFSRFFLFYSKLITAEVSGQRGYYTLQSLNKIFNIYEEKKLQ